jgi:predicted transcriptional regulator
VVSLALSRSQVNHVVRTALGERLEHGVSPFGSGPQLHDGHVRQALSDHYRSLQGNRRLSRSLLAGLLVLSCFSPDGPELGIKEISQQLELNSSTVHRYVATLLAAGLLERDPDTRRYRLATT